MARFGSANSRTSTGVDELLPFLEHDVANDALGLHPFGAGVGGALEDVGIGLPGFVAFAVAWQFLNISARIFEDFDVPTRTRVQKCRRKERINSRTNSHP